MDTRLKTKVDMKRQRFYINLNVIAFQFIPYYIHSACGALACSSYNEFSKCETTRINTDVCLILVRDNTPYDYDVMVGKLWQTKFGKGRMNIKQILMRTRVGVVKV